MLLCSPKSLNHFLQVSRSSSAWAILALVLTTPRMQSHGLPLQITFQETPILLDKGQSHHLLSPEHADLHFKWRLEVLSSY